MKSPLLTEHQAENLKNLIAQKRRGQKQEFAAHFATVNGLGGTYVGDHISDVLNRREPLTHPMKAKLVTAIYHDKPGIPVKDEEWLDFHERVGLPLSKTTSVEQMEDPKSLHVDFKTAYSGGNHWAIKSAVSLTEHPELLEGKSWPVEEIKVQHDKTEFDLPSEYQDAFTSFEKANYTKLRLFDDREKVLLTKVPWTCDDSPTLFLETKQTHYSRAQFYSREIANRDLDRNRFINESFGSAEIYFAHAFCFHAVIATKDDKILVVKRSHRVIYDPNKWQCSLSEQAHPNKDVFEEEGSVLRWGKRLLWEELRLKDQEGYSDRNFHALSIFLVP